MLNRCLFWIFYLYERFIKADSTPTFLPPVLVATTLGIVVFLWRYWMVASLYSYGLDTPATVHEIGFYRDRGRISYVYSFQGQKYVSGSRIMKTKRTRSIQIGDQVNILVDPNDPKRALIRDLYT
jgi:hypothetical protein